MEVLPRLSITISRHSLLTHLRRLSPSPDFPKPHPYCLPITYKAVRLSSSTYQLFVGSLHIAEVKLFPTSSLCYITVSSRHSSPQGTRIGTNRSTVANSKIKKENLHAGLFLINFSNLPTARTGFPIAHILSCGLHTSKRGKVPELHCPPACRPSFTPQHHLLHPSFLRPITQNIPIREQRHFTGFYTF
jgi:hypothetical protein